MGRNEENMKLSKVFELTIAFLIVCVAVVLSLALANMAKILWVGLFS